MSYEKYNFIKIIEPTTDATVGFVYPIVEHNVDGDARLRFEDDVSFNGYLHSAKNSHFIFLTDKKAKELMLQNGQECDII